MSFLYFFFRGFVSGETPDSTSGCLTCNIRYFTHEINIFLSMKIIFFSLLTKEGLDPYFIHLYSYVMHTPPKSIVRLVHVFQLMFCFYYYSFLSEGGIQSSKDEDKLECFDVKDGGRLYLNDLGRILYCYRTIIHVHVLQNCNA